MKKAYYKIVVKRDQRVGTGEQCYCAYIPELGIAADGDTIAEVLDNANDLIEFHVSCLIEEGEDIPIADATDTFVFDTSIDIPQQLHA